MPFRYEYRKIQYRLGRTNSEIRTVSRLDIISKNSLTDLAYSQKKKKPAAAETIVREDPDGSVQWIDILRRLVENR